MQVAQGPQPAQLPQPDQPTAPGTPAGPFIFVPPIKSSDPVAVLRAARAQRDELRDQLENLEERREELVGELRGADGPARSGIERRIAEIDQRVSEVDRQLAAADLNVARATAIPGAVVPKPPPVPEREDPVEAIGMVAGLLTVFVLFPLTIAYARRIWRRGALAVAELPKVLAERLTRLDQAVDAIAIEVERISEGQRFLTKVMTDSNAGRAIGTGPAEPIEIDARERAPIPRSTAR
jgi:hypothetical protein